MQNGQFHARGRPTIIRNPVGDIKTFFSRDVVGLIAEQDEIDLAKKMIIFIQNGDLREEE